MTRIVLVLLLLFLPSNVWALPDPPKPNHRTLFVGVALLAASKSADAWTTRSLLDRGGWENNPVFGRHPSLSRQITVNALFFTAQTAAFSYTEHNRRRWVRWLGRAYLGLAIEEHSRLAACATGINPQAPRVRNCRSLLPF